MCGICGFIFLRGERAQGEEALARMNGRIAHRGPDDEGFFLGERATLANRRLSIVDLAGGHQPIFNEDGRVCVVFNGEIYNQRALRQELEKSGHRFATQTDTEVLVHLYEEHGEGMVERLNGMFVFAVWDEERQRGIIVRDRLGIKPLYYTRTGNVLVFGSEAKALLAYPGVGAEIDCQGLDLFLTLRYLPADKTLFAGIRKLQPGYLLSVDARAGTVEEREYWHPELLPKGAAEASEDEVVEEIYALLEDAVRIRLMSDVPFGAFLSGGLDSSGVVALMSRILGGGVETFSIGFSEEERLDERLRARLVAQSCDSRHREVDCTADKVESLPRLIHHFDEPFADPIIVPTFQVSELAAQHVKVVLTGEGADEIFGGYTRFVADRHFRALGALAPWMWRGAGALPPLIPFPGLRQQVERALYLGQLDDGERFLQWVIAFAEEERRQLYARELQGQIGAGACELYRKWESAFPQADPTNRMLFCDMKIRLPECMLARTDRMTMAVSLEGRTPFLDHRLVERVLQLPGYLKVRGKNEKYLLKRVLSRILPEAIVRRKKQGLAVPFAQWTRYGIETHIRRILRRERVVQRGFFAPDYVQELLDRWGAHAAHHSQLIWSLLCLELWCRIYLDRDLEPDTPLSEVA